MEVEIVFGRVEEGATPPLTASQADDEAQRGKTRSQKRMVFRF